MPDLVHTPLERREYGIMVRTGWSTARAPCFPRPSTAFPSNGTAFQNRTIPILMRDDEKRHDDDDRSDLAEQLERMMRNANMRFMFDQHDPQESDSGHEQPSDSDDQEQERLHRIQHFELTPREVRSYLDRFVISQHEAKKVLSVAICDHYNHVRQCIEEPAVHNEDYVKPNVLLLGPTGVGKTYLMRCVARLIGVPFVKADATKFSETGYVGDRKSVV